MTSVNANLSSIAQNNVNELLNKILSQGNKIQSGNENIVQENSPAYSLDSGMMCGMSNFDITMNNAANFRDMLSNTSDIFSKMRTQGEALLKLINHAHEGSYSQEELESMNKEASDILSNIDALHNSAEFNGINPLNSTIGVNIPDWQNVVQQFSGTNDAQEVESAITDLLADINFDCDISAEANGSAFNMKASANVKIGFTDDGALQITVDATLDYDLSGITDKGVQSNDALELIKNFLDLLGGKFDGINTASSMFDSLFGGNNMFGEGFMPVKDGESSQLKGQMVQQATITLDNVNQIPNIAINML